MFPLPSCFLLHVVMGKVKHWNVSHLGTVVKQRHKQVLHNCKQNQINTGFMLLWSGLEKSAHRDVRTEKLLFIVYVFCLQSPFFRPRYLIGLTLLLDSLEELQFWAHLHWLHFSALDAASWFAPSFCQFISLPSKSCVFFKKIIISVTIQLLFSCQSASVFICICV